MNPSGPQLQRTTFSPFAEPRLVPSVEAALAAQPLLNRRLLHRAFVLLGSSGLAGACLLVGAKQLDRRVARDLVLVGQVRVGLTVDPPDQVVLAHRRRKLLVLGLEALAVWAPRGVEEHQGRALATHEHIEILGSKVNNLAWH